MSWVEDNNIDSYEDITECIEEHWKNGVHIDKLGNEHKLSDMKNEHLLNTIKFFNGADTTPLEEEFKSRM